MENQEKRRELKHCQGIRRDGQPCQSPAVSASGFCYTHDPEKSNERIGTRSKGGKNSAHSVRLDRLMPTRLKPVFGLLERAMVEVYKGSLPSARGTAIAALARACVSVLEAGELEERVREIESKVDKR